jgi:peptide/nickel transport system substrate-binding protein
MVTAIRSILGQSFGLVCCLAMVLAGCAPAADTARNQPSNPAGPERPSGPKSLKIGILNEEPVSGIAVFNGTSAGAYEPVFIFHGGLTIYDAQGNLKPHFAEKVPSLADGDWKLLPDGGTEVTWKIRKGITWHDGTPLTAEDFVLGTRVVMDNDLPVNRGRGVRLISDVSAPDPQTFVVRWKQPFSQSNVSGPLDNPAVPNHIMGEVYARGDKTFITNHPYWSREFVGLGPYRMGEWLLGSHLEAIAYDNYFLGRPKIDRLILRYFTDLNTLVANQLSGDIDVMPSGALKVEQATALQQQWAPTNGGTVMPLRTKFNQVDLQWRDPNAPWTRDVRVRQALTHLIDRQALVDSLAGGLTEPADTPMLRDDPNYRLVEQQGLARYPYDMTRAERLMNDAGWRRGPDGLLQTADGERLRMEMGSTGATPGAPEAREAITIADQWKSGGVDSTFKFMNQDASDLNEIRALLVGGHQRSSGLDPISTFESYITPEVAAQSNRWRGKNRGGHSNPEYDRLFNELLSTLDPAQQLAATASLAKLASETVSFIPLYYSFDIAAFRKGVRNVGQTTSNQRANAWNIHTWEVD